MQRLFALLLFASFSFSAIALQEQGSDATTASITDDLTVFIHTGPSRNYRIIGTIQAGQPITVLQRDGDPQFIQMTDNEGQTGWVEAQYVSNTPSIRAQLPALEEQVGELQERLSSLQQQYQRVRSEKNALEQQNQRMAGELETALQSNITLQSELDNADNTAMIEWFTRGGIVAVVCILLGILLTYLPKKRRREDQWM
ncbi:TIGR04211 family SH3 domain-containing protein [Alteromonas oceanisediminis]|uniref:TIGR04211 family SH3 domain-containing protein n=1 Tax=Alteromonas oceanisediminis TaxID=2836180 RepID=UPI001BDB3879|nr:TIGR04211 family SH3 domain-containing protein [Alteromonas oceanisediminis]MBT0585381.1 TIGR04211 family SH3 domain-containing protein [Alteromonas oceanisediminis]